MKIRIIPLVVVMLVIILVLAGIVFLLVSRYHVFKGHTLSAAAKISTKAEKDIYYCPMHPGFTSDKPGDCGICGMKLIKKETGGHGGHTAGAATAERRVIYYRNPMNPEVTSPVPMKDPMGMDYVPVYEQEADGKSGIYISPEKQQFIGVKKEIVRQRKLTHQILTVGKIAYNPQLYVAQQEYLQALKTQKALASSSITEQSNSLLEAAERKLLLLGMTEEQVKELAKQNKPQGNLYLPAEGNTVWVYMTIYEYEIGLVKEGIPVEIGSIAFPGEKFSGKITSITPVLDPMTRSVQAWAEVDNPGNKLKPEMFVNVKINVDLGEKLAVSEEAIINTGKRTLVVVTDDSGNFLSKEVKLGQSAEGFYEVLEGLREGENIVTSGNFLIDSESRLQSAISGSEHKHGQ
ncbi:MAG: efflux RND transporter periplasmic adaptor subunit [Candidatus Omnitrophica bacterium]|nr:efflux RND transporter periplasmic adaptor subunit [Candidatus Omnitrophota bacterium]